jgi:hypothetical protein
MKFQKRIPKQFEKRTRTFFAFFPVTIYHGPRENHIRDTRWLERVTVEEEYWCLSFVSPHWKLLSFVDEKSS